MPQSVGAPWMWVSFTALILVLLVLDMFLFHKKTHEVRIREAIGWSVFWIALGLSFGAVVYHWFGPRAGLEYLTGYLIEKALSVDNLFVFIIIFSTFGVKPEYQHRVLFWGIVGALVMRAFFIFLGAAMLTWFTWMIYVFGAFLLFTGVKILSGVDPEVHPDRNPLLKIFGRWVPLAQGPHSGHFTKRENGKLYATTLLPVLVVIEATDVVFAVDSIPAVFGVTHDPFIVYTSNIFAILGLRALYFVLSAAMQSFRFLKTGLGLVLVFVGAKMCGEHFYEVPTEVSLGVVMALLGGSVLASILWPGMAPEEADAPSAADVDPKP